jgi:hypothetical protein
MADNTFDKEPKEKTRQGAKEIGGLASASRSNVLVAAWFVTSPQLVILEETSLALEIHLVFERCRKCEGRFFQNDI